MYEPQKVKHKKSSNHMITACFCSGNDSYFKQLSKLLEVLSEISEKDEKEFTDAEEIKADDQSVKKKAKCGDIDNKTVNSIFKNEDVAIERKSRRAKRKLRKAKRKTI